MTAPPELCTAALRGQPRSRYQIDCAGSRLHVHARTVATVLRVDGEIDASNAHLLTREIRRFARLKAPLILDLTHLDFMSSAGLAALQQLHDEHRLNGVHCRVVGGPALRRLVQVLPDHGLPLVDSVPEALRHIEGVVRARRRFVRGLARQEEPQRT
ncbi:STAS domain-containing protein [Mycobacterium sp. Marseille-P9652]|uniref:STAS domain-containing protein n=1 Tax=Mycobacterium sp. Marseille-P9652 TaxID=2654950 RepID=UPI0012E8840D|nr:STAS domain-containing protein [Mycobacterium sp. Marseille-P9652]